MRIVIGTTTGFHLRRLAVELNRLGEEIEYWSYLPKYRLQREGLNPKWAHSMFRSLLPGSALALTRGAPWQMRAVDAMLEASDGLLAANSFEADVFIGLSSMAVKSAAQARAGGAKIVIERGSRHVLSQNRLVSAQGGTPLSSSYIKRELASYAEADIITVLSQHAADSFIEEGVPEERLYVCPLGVDLQQFHPTPRPPGPMRLLFVGGWTHRKGADVLMSALDLRPTWRLTHVGVADHHDNFHRHPRVDHIGHRSHNQLAELMSKHHILVLPSREDGFGMVLLEALAAGLPVVASRMTGGPDIRDAIDEPRWVEIVEPGDVADLVRGIERMEIEERPNGFTPLRSRLSRNDQAYFSWQGYGLRYQAFLKRLMEA